ncbi:MAG: thiamine pyrophosphate-dependent enzyme [Candidatus Odinarchaeota archaeon]
MSRTKDFLLNDPPYREVLLGNDAFVRGMIEAGVKVAAAYPGSPTSEMGIRLANLSESGIYFEFSTNEKVAMEIAATASIANVPATTFLKSVGLNVASDTFVQLSMMSMPGGFVIILGDDPKPHSTQNTQDNRYFARLAYVPMIEPANAQEAKDYFVFAMEYSRKWQMPVVIRSTTRICHQTGMVEFGPVNKSKSEPHFDPNLGGGYIPLPGNVPKLRPKTLLNLKKWEKLANEGALLREERVGDGEPQIGIIASGHAYAATKSSLRILNVSANILKLGIVYPLPMDRIIDFIQNNKTVKIVEELDPFIEEAVKAELFDRGITGIRIIGKAKEDDWLELMLSEYTSERLTEIFSKILNLPVPLEYRGPTIEIPARPPVLCPGCGHRTAFHAARIVMDKFNGITTTDIGCYTLGALPPHEMGSLLFCMGTSVTTANGLALVMPDKPVLSFVGDSTFFHATMPGIVNAVFNKHRGVLMIMDNGITAMTGHQPNPNSGKKSKGVPLPPKYLENEMISIDDTLKAWGVKFVKRVPAYDVAALVEALEEAFAHKEFAVVIQEEPCALMRSTAERRAGTLANPYYIDHEICRNIQKCVVEFSCPAIEQLERVTISTDLCVGCACCIQTCPMKSKPIKQMEEFKRI